MKPSVFISRSVERAASFSTKITDHVSNTQALSLIHFSSIDQHSLPDVDWLFFYSQTGADHFFQQFDSNSLKSKNLYVAAFGPKTSAYISQRYYPVKFTGSGESQSTISHFLADHDPSNVCIIRGKTSVNSIYPLLEGKCRLHEMIVYENRPKTDFAIQPADILVFTSPMNLETYFARYPWHLSQCVVVIGSTTAKAALDQGISEIHISKEPSMESLADTVIHLCQSWQKK